MEIYGQFSGSEKLDYLSLCKGRGLVMIKYYNGVGSLWPLCIMVPPKPFHCIYLIWIFRKRKMVLAFNFTQSCFFAIRVLSYHTIPLVIFCKLNFNTVKFLQHLYSFPGLNTLAIILMHPGDISGVLLNYQFSIKSMLVQSFLSTNVSVASVYCFE